MPVSDEFLNSNNGMRGLAETFVRGWLTSYPPESQIAPIDSLTRMLINAYKDGLKDARPIGDT